MTVLNMCTCVLSGGTPNRLVRPFGGRCSHMPHYCAYNTLHKLYDQLLFLLFPIIIERLAVGACVSTAFHINERKIFYYEYLSDGRGYSNFSFWYRVKERKLLTEWNLNQPART